MKVKNIIKKGLYGIVAGAMVITSTYTGVYAANKVDTLLANMTIEEKAAQIMQVDVRWATPEDVLKYQFGSILAGGGATPNSGNSMTDWATRADQYQKAIVDAHKIPLLYGVDAVHGNNNVDDATMFPHNIGIAAANDESLTKRVGQAVASEVKATGANWTFTPTIGVPHNERWGRTYETFGDDYQRVSKLGNAYIQGIQEQNVLASAKHYLGEGLTTNGTNQGNVVMSDDDYHALVQADMSNETVKELLTPYKTAIDNGVQSIMVTYNSFNGVKTHGNYDLVTTLLRDKLGFNGVVVSDYNGLDQISSYIDSQGHKKTASTYKEKAIACVNAGVDLLMVAENGNWQKLYSALVEALNEGAISEERINEACRRILKAKDDLGLLDGENLYSSSADKNLFGGVQHQAIARDAVAQSLTLLKNTEMSDGQTMMQKLQNMKRIVVAGSNADDIGNQCGGWTITWQGSSGNITEGTTIYQGIKDNLEAKGGKAIYAANGYFEQDVDAAIVVVGEKPYAESNGDSSASHLKISSSDLEVLNTIKQDHPQLPIVLVLVTGRPLTIANQVVDERIQAIVSAWLPGSEGAGVADVLFQEKDFSGTNPITWPWYATDIEKKFDDESKVLYKTGYGLKKTEISEIKNQPEDPAIIDLEKTNGKVEAEAFISKHDSIILENNDTSIGNFWQGRDVVYKVKVPEQGEYSVTVNQATQNNNVNAAFDIYVDGILTYQTSTPAENTGGWANFKEALMSNHIYLPAGVHELKVVSQTRDYNIDYFMFKKVSDQYVPPKDPEPSKPNTGTGAILKEDAVKVSMSSSENSGSMSWYAGNQKISHKNIDQPALDIRAVDDSSITTIQVDDTTEYNSFLGMGTSVDESTVYNLWKMNENDRYAFIKRLVDPINGSGNTLFRLTIGTADFTAQPFYTYYDGTGKELNGQPDWYNETGKGFTIDKDKEYHIIETIQLIQKAARECGVEDELKFFASPWTPPGWMKTETYNSRSYPNNELLLKGGKLSDDHIVDAAKYYVRFIEEYQQLGIPVYAITLQNEPMLEINYPSCLLSGQQEARLGAAIKSELAKSTILTDEQKDVKIWAFDHNPGDLNSYMNAAYNTNRDAIDGAAVHDYGGELSNMTTLHNQYNDKSIHLTERSVWGTTGMDRIIQYYRNYAESYNCWVTMLDSKISTHQWVGTPDPTAFVQDANDPDYYWATPEVYLMSQFSKYIRPGYIRVQSNYGSTNTVTNVVFKNPETNELVMVVVNNTNQAQDFKVVNNGIQFNATLPAQNCATYRWQASDNQPIGLEIPGILKPEDAKNVSGWNVQDGLYQNTTANANATYLINVKESGYYNVIVKHAIGPTEGPSANSNTGDKVIVLKDQKGQILGQTITKRFDTWTGEWGAWSNTDFDAQIQVYLEKGVQNIILESRNDSINIGDLTFIKTDINHLPGFVPANNYSYGEKILLETKDHIKNICFVETGDLFEYKVNIQKEGTYRFKMNYATTNTTTDFNLYIDGNLVKEHVRLPITGANDAFENGFVDNIDMTQGEHTIRFVVNENGTFNLRSFSVGAYINAQIIGDVLKENELKDREIGVTLTDGQFIDELDVNEWKLEGLPQGTPFEVIRDNDNHATIRFIGEATEDFDTDLSVKIVVDASQLGDSGYVLTDNIIVIAVDDDESLNDIIIQKDSQSFDVVLIGGTFHKDISINDIALSDSLNKYIKIQSVNLNKDGSLKVFIERKENYIDIEGTITIKVSGYSDGSTDLESQVTLLTNAKPIPIEVGEGLEGQLNHSYDANGTIANATNGKYESFYIDVKEAGDYILAFDITNNDEMMSALSINGGLGLFSTNNLASISFGKYWNNTNVSYKTLLHFDEKGLYTLQLKANNTFQLTNATLTLKPQAIDIMGDYTLTPVQIIDGSDDKLWAIENKNVVGYTNVGGYQDYFVHVKETGQYNFSIQYATTGEDSIVELLSVIDGKERSLGTIDLTSTGDWAQFKNSQEVEIELPAGEQLLRLKVAQGGFNTKAIHLVKESVIEPEVIIPEITVQNPNVQVYVDNHETVIDLLGLKVMYDGQDVTYDSALVNIDSSQYNSEKAGDYDIVVTAKNSKGQDVVKTYTIKVIHTPIMEYDASEIVVGSQFDPMLEIFVKDYDGKDITHKVKVERNNVDLSKPGIYSVIYSVVNGLGDEFIFEREVKVIAKKVDDIPSKPQEPDQKPEDNHPQIPEKPTENKPQKPIIDSDVLGEEVDTTQKDKEILVGQKINGVKTSDSTLLIPYAILALCSVGVYLTMKKRQV
ncbi:MAG: carbohydrate-binding protein [Coprobacillus sp.]|nr:carbohydrate-binding protein [Coprobacillus sp.]